MKHYEGKFVREKDNIAIWVKLNTEMIPCGLLQAAILYNSDCDSWIQITKEGESENIRFTSEMYLWHFRDFFDDLWVKENAEQLIKIGFKLYCSEQFGNYLGLDTNVNCDAKWKKVKKLMKGDR